MNDRKKKLAELAETDRIIKLAEDLDANPLDSGEEKAHEVFENILNSLVDGLDVELPE